MSDADSEFRIKATIDPSGANDGAAQVAGDLDQIKGSTDEVAESAEKGATGFEKMAKEAGGMREGRRLATELFETMEGGGRSISGLSGLLRLFLVSCEGLGPVGMAIGGVALALTQVIALHDTHEKTQDDAKASTDAWAAANKLLDDSLKALKITAEAFSGIDLRSAKEATAELEKQKAALDEIARAQDALISARLALNIAQLDKQAADEEMGVTDKDKLEAIKRKYDYQRALARNDYDQQKANDELAQKQADLKALQDQQQALTAEKAAAWQDIGGPSGQVNKDRQALAQMGVQSDYWYAVDQIKKLSDQRDYAAAGVEGYKPLSPQEQINLENYQRRLPELRAKGDTYDAERVKKQLEDAQLAEYTALSKGDNAGAATARAQVDQLSAALEKIADLDGSLKAMDTAFKQAVTTYNSTEEQLQKLGPQIEAAQIGIQTAQTKVQTAAYQSGASVEQAGNKETQTQAEDAARAQRQATQKQHQEQAEQHKEQEQEHRELVDKIHQATANLRASGYDPKMIDAFLKHADALNDLAQRLAYISNLTIGKVDKNTADIKNIITHLKKNL